MLNLNDVDTGHLIDEIFSTNAFTESQIANTLSKPLSPLATSSPHTFLCLLFKLTLYFTLSAFCNLL